MLFGQVPNMFCRRPRPVLDDVLQDRPTPLEQTIGPQAAEPEATEPEDIEPEVVKSETTKPETVCYPFSFHTLPASAKVSITFCFSHFYLNFFRFMPITFGTFRELICG